MKKIVLILLLFVFAVSAVKAQNIYSGGDKVNYLSPKEYEIGGVTISGVQYLDQNVLLYLTGLEIGKKISVPGQDIADAIKKLWEQGLFSDVKVSVTNTIGDKIFLDIYLEERPRLSKFSFKGVKKGEADDIREQIKLTKGSQVTENMKLTAERYIKDYFIDKGYFNADVTITEEVDSSLANSIILSFDINKNQRIKINKIIFEGNNSIKDAKLRRKMKETKQKTWYNIFKASKFIPKNYADDKKKIIEKYNEEGFRDALITYDSISPYDEKTINLYIGIEEGHKFYFRNISWLGNTMYTSEQLSHVLGIKKGDVYNGKVLDEKLMYDPMGVMALYQDNGYLFSNVQPIEVLVENDSIDLEMRIYEGKQATVNRVTLVGNTRTNDHVIMREVRTRPGSLYNRSEVQRTIRELAQLGYFNAEKLNVDFNPDPVSGTVDLEYTVEEKPSDQIQVSGGYGSGMFVGTLGVTFTNFSLRNIFNFKTYRPLPSGDGQRLSIQASASGLWYQNYSFSFVDPWFGGKKPNSFSLSVYHSNVRSYSSKEKEETKEERKTFKVTGAGIGLGQRLQVPDDYFTLYLELSYKRYNIHNYTDYAVIFSQGVSNNLSLKAVLGRSSSGPNPIFPTTGSEFSVSAELTPPYSYMNGKDYTNPDMTLQERYKWIEYHKYKASAKWFTTLFGPKDGSSRALVLVTKAEFGLLGMYNKNVGKSPFEYFQLGGDGLYGYNLYGAENIGLRGYSNQSLTPAANGYVYNKYTVELRYPMSLNPTATFYAIVFAEAGNCWHSIENFRPFDVKRSAGVGVRVYMQMIGLIGVDWGYGFDEVPGTTGANGSQFHFVIGQNF
ncbi:MAG: outer membrane protein assembly factor BamA [Bacteroidales bacterium]|jgi:outer membrane protein insertion porin family|nr:outer membrane protein assembly factor BamA [Bacteroidales bacterium]